MKMKMKNPYPSVRPCLPTNQRRNATRPQLQTVKTTNNIEKVRKKLRNKVVLELVWVISNILSLIYAGMDDRNGVVWMN
jgi:hypothetical protein